MRLNRIRWPSKHNREQSAFCLHCFHRSVFSPAPLLLPLTSLFSFPHNYRTKLPNRDLFVIVSLCSFFELHSSTLAPRSRSLLRPFACRGLPPSEGVQSKPGRGEQLPNTRANIWAELNWTNTDNAGTIAFPGCLPCCSFIGFLSSAELTAA